MVPFEQKRFRRLNKSRMKAKAKTNSGTNTPTMNSDFGAFLPKHGDYSLKALTDIDYESKEKADPFRPNFKKRSKKSKWYIKVGSVKNNKNNNKRFENNNIKNKLY